MNPGEGVDLGNDDSYICDARIGDTVDFILYDKVWMGIHHAVGLPLAFAEPVEGIKRLSLRGDE